MHKRERCQVILTEGRVRGTIRAQDLSSLSFGVNHSLIAGDAAPPHVLDHSMPERVKAIVAWNEELNKLSAA